MNYNFSFWAQNLDNMGDDHAEKNGKLLESTDTEEREALTWQISQVTMNTKGEEITFGEASATIYFVKSEFVLKVIWSQVDRSGRKAPIACYGEISENVDFDEWTEKCVEAFEQFTHKIGRENFPEDAKQASHLALQKLKKKEVTWKQPQIFLPIIGILLLANLMTCGLMYLTIGKIIYLVVIINLILILINIVIVGLYMVWLKYIKK